MDVALKPIVLAAGLLGLAACATAGSGETGSATAAADGRVVALTRCASCHAIDGENFSPRQDAPALQAVAWRYGTKLRAEALMKGMHVGHKEMPQIELSSVETDALVAYLNSLSGAGRR